MENDEMSRVLCDIAQNCEVNTDLSTAKQWKDTVMNMKMSPEVKSFYLSMIDNNIKTCAALKESRIKELTSQVIEKARNDAQKNGQKIYENIDEYSGAAPYNVAKKIVACENTNKLREDESSLKSIIGEYFALEQDYIKKDYDKKTKEMLPAFTRPASEALYNAYIYGPMPTLSKHEALKRALFLSKTDDESLETHGTALLNFLARLFDTPNQILVLQGFEIGGQGKGIWLSALQNAAKEIGLSYNVSSGITATKVDSKVGNSVFLVDQEYNGAYCPDINNVADKKTVNLCGKFIYEYQVKSMANLVYATNADISDPNDRRYAVLRCDLNRPFEQNFGVCDFPKGYEAAEAWIAEGIKALIWYAVNDHTIKVVKTVNSEGFLQKFSYFLSKLDADTISQIKNVETVSDLASFLMDNNPKVWQKRNEIVRPMVQLMNSGKVKTSSSTDNQKVAQYRMIDMDSFISDILKSSETESGYKAIYEFFTPNGPEIGDDNVTEPNERTLDKIINAGDKATFIFHTTDMKPILLPVFRTKLALKKGDESWYVLHTNFSKYFKDDEYDSVYDELNMKFFKGKADKVDKLPDKHFLLTSYSLTPYDLKYIYQKFSIMKTQANLSYEKINDALSSSLQQLQSYETMNEFLDYMSANTEVEVIGYAFALINKLESNCYSIEKIKEALSKKNTSEISKRAQMSIEKYALKLTNLA